MAILGEPVYYSVEDLERALGQRNLNDYVRACEAGFMKQTASIAYDAAWNFQLKAIFIAGPSASGKTTFNERLSSALHMHGRPTCTLSLDDYYKDGMEPRIIDGRPDLESIDTLDLHLMLEQIETLLAGGTVEVPTFDFMTRRRVFTPDKRLRVPPRGLLLVEGLHGLSSQISGRLTEGEYLNVFIMPHAVLFGDERLIRARDIRVLRRLCRDSIHRNTSPLATLDYWPMLDSAEAATFPEYIANAHYFINSAVGYEFGVIPALAAGKIDAELKRLERGELTRPALAHGHSDFADLPAAVREARHLLRVCSKIPGISPDFVPRISILNEFIS